MDKYNILVSNAKTLLAEIDAIKEELKPMDPMIANFDEGLGSRIGDLVLKSVLLFGEFDNGKPFRQSTKGMGPGKISTRYLLKNDVLLNDLQKTLTLFIEHIQEYRINT